MIHLTIRPLSSPVDYDYVITDETPGIEVTEGPEIPPEVHNPRPIDGDRCMAAVRAMSKGGLF